ncbi:MAG TPA: hypothetical protein PLD27_05630 [bacterium]|nr:hypothetical protein [bacterium]HOL47934.1 hypothetical protein [bacterium]HPQ19401.1 hypothetical protein [bacterium]
MAIEKAEDIKLILELLKIKEEITEEETLRNQILKEGVEKRLKEKLGIQTTLVGRIEPGENYDYLYVKDVNNNFPDCQLDEKKQLKKVPIRLFIEKLKDAFKKDFDNKIEQYEKLKKELDDLFN